MNPTPLNLPDDPFGCRDDLRDALADPDLNTSGEAAEGAAYRVARALGRCRLYGIAPGDDLDGVMPPPLAEAAASELTRRLASWADEAGRLGDRWDAAVDPAEADNLCAGLLGARMDAWAVGVALDEAYLDAVAEDAAGANSLGAAIDRASDALDRFDQALEGQTEVLATITGTNLLTGWRALLAPTFGEDLPWWLDGRLEEAAGRSDAEAARSMPGAGSWAALRQHSLRLASREPASPPVAERPMMAASTPGPGPHVRLLRWVSRDGKFLAELRVPEEPTPEQAAVPRPLNVTHRGGPEDGAMAVELASLPVRLGAAEPRSIDERGKAMFRLDELGSGAPRLSVGDQSEEWLPLPVEG
jgi:hypothetical protein